jgi:transposase
MDHDTAVERVLARAPEVSGEVMPGLERHRRWSVEEKLRILAQSVAPGSSPTLTCRMHRISSGQLYTWRKQFRQGELTGFVPVSIAPETAALPAPDLLPDPPKADPVVAGIIEVELPTGVKLRVPGDADEASLRRILSALS